MTRPLILVTNDDGIHAPGIRTLIRIIRDYGNVVVVAPDKAQSGMGHAVTVASPLRYKKIHEEPGFAEYSCSGTPVDSVKLGEKIILGRRPDLLVSGINHGSNAGINIMYSGTMGSAIEAAMLNIPAIWLSLCSYDQQPDFDTAEPFIRNIISQVLTHGIPEHICLNVNIPAVPVEELKGIKICRMGKGYWDESLEERFDPGNRPYYWLAGEFVSLDGNPGTDEWAIQNNYIAVVPIQLDMTSHQTIPLLKHLENHDQKR